LAAFNIVLFTLTERNRVGVWTFLANRSHPDTEPMIGWFAQNHLLVMDLSTNPTVADLVQQARNVVIEANAFQDLPPQLLARALGAPKRKRPRISFEMLAQPQTERARLPQGMRIGPAPLPRFLRHPEAGLKLHVHDFGLGAINFSAQFAADRFQTPDVQDLLSQVCRVARQMVRFPYARLSSFNAHAKA
jgi:non-ribosomal peptide synthetase component F